MRKSSNQETFEHVVGVWGAFRITFAHKRTPMDTTLPHSHGSCELTVYTESRKCVYVNNSVYITPGICMFTFRPGELHGGVHEKGELHERYVIEFYAECFNSIPHGRELLRCFFDRAAGEHNMIVLPPRETEESFELLDGIFDLAESDLPEKHALMLANFIRYLSLLNRFYLTGETRRFDVMPELLSRILAYISENLAEPIRIGALAARFGVSVATMERLFRHTLATTPREYIFTSRIERAKMLLRSGASVTEACYGAGFRDYSHFIADFHACTGVTPKEYRAAQTR